MLKKFTSYFYWYITDLLITEQLLYIENSSLGKQTSKILLTRDNFQSASEKKRSSRPSCFCKKSVSLLLIYKNSLERFSCYRNYLVQKTSTILESFTYQCLQVMLLILFVASLGDSYSFAEAAVQSCSINSFMTEAVII